MHQSSRTVELQYDSKIEKTTCRLKKETKQQEKPSFSSLGPKLAFDLVESFSESEEAIETMSNERTLSALAASDSN